jgi:hypothetical protein
MAVAKCGRSPDTPDAPPVHVLWLNGSFEPEPEPRHSTTRAPKVGEHDNVAATPQSDDAERSVQRLAVLRRRRLGVTNPRFAGIGWTRDDSRV